MTPTPPPPGVDVETGKLPFMQPDNYERRRSPGDGSSIGSVYADDRCCWCYRPVKPDAARLRTARDNGGDWYLVGAAFDLSGDDWKDFQREVDGSHVPTLLPIGPDCLRQHPEFRFAIDATRKP